MTPIAIVLAVSAIALLSLAGYLVGARRGRAARAALLEEHDTQRAKVVELEARLAQVPASRPDQMKAELEAMLAPLVATKKDANVDVLRREMQYVIDAVTARERNNDVFREEVRGLLSNIVQKEPDPRRMREEIQKLVAPLVAQRTDGTSEVRKVMSEVLAPVLDRERMGRELSAIQIGKGGLGELPRLLDAIAEKGGFAAVVLSDEAGLPLAASAGASDVEEVAGTAAFFLTLSDRAERAALPRPLSCVVLDETNRLTLHRMFTVGPSRFTVTAVSRGLPLAPSALDPALSPLERVLGRRELS